MEHRDRDEIADQASQWDARLRSPDCTEDERVRFAAWRDGNPRCRAEFERLQAFVSLLRGERGRADVRGLRETAIASAYRRRWQRAWAVAAGVGTLAVGVALWGSLARGAHWDALHALAALTGQSGRYETDVGQRSTLALQDGSSIELNARTRVRVQFGASRRLVRLLEGQALFHVARDSQRPFIVRAGDRDIVALGTAFDVRLDESSVRVTLLEGKVEVDHSERETSHPQVLVPGQQLVALRAGQSRQNSARAVAVDAAETVRTVDVAQATSWRDGRVFLEDLPLDEAVAEMNRYSPVQIIVSDASLEALRVNGMFRVGEQDALVTALREYFPDIVAERTGPSEIVLRQRRR